MRPLLLALLLCIPCVGAQAEPVEPAEPVAATITKLVSGYKFTEGPALDAEGHVYFTDIPNDRILKYDVKEGRASVWREDSGGANGLMFDGSGHLLACEGGRRRLVRIQAEATTVLAERFEEQRLNSPNDLAIDASGGIYFTDPRYGKQDDRELTFEGVFYQPAKGKLVRVCEEVVKPNGILLSPDGTRLYVADSKQQLIWMYRIEKPIQPLAGKVFAKLDPEARGGPDGMSTDEAGRVYCAGQGRIWIWDPQGTLIETIKMPEGPANCVVAKDARYSLSLYVTARTSLYRVTRKQTTPTR